METTTQEREGIFFRGRVSKLFKPAPIYPLVLLRLGFGAGMSAWALYMLVSGNISRFLSHDGFLFHYKGLSWLQPLPDAGMYAVFLLIALSSLAVGAGWYFRVSAVIFNTLFLYVTLIDKTNYLSYYYYVLLMGFMLLISPAHRLFSLDLIRKPSLRVDYIPGWFLLAIRVQVAMVFFFAGMAKLDSDWLFHGRPVSFWLSGAAARFGWDIDFTQAHTWLPVAVSWILVLSDFIFPHFLLDRRTAFGAFWLVVLMQMLFLLFFPAGFLPVLIIATGLVFIPSHRAHNFISRISYFLNDLVALPGDVFKTGGAYMVQYRNKTLFLLLLSVFLGVQVLLPVGLFLKWGSDRWADAAFHFSWNMQVNHRSGQVKFWVVDTRTGYEQPVDLDRYLTPHQQQSMAEAPLLILQFARFLNDSIAGTHEEVRAESTISLNGRRPVLLLDKSKDLFSQLDEAADVR